MNPFKSIIEFKANIPSVFDLRLGESYDDYLDVLYCAQERHTGDSVVDYLLEEYVVFVDVDSDDNGRINEILLSYYGEMNEILPSLMRSFEYSHFEELKREDWENGEMTFSYHRQISNDKYHISITSSSDDSRVKVRITSRVKDVMELQESNIRYYHEPLGGFAEKNGP